MKKEGYGLKIGWILIFLVIVFWGCSTSKETVNVDKEEYSSYLKKIWIVDRTVEERKYGEAFDFVITEIVNDKIKGYLRIGGGVEKCYFDGLCNEDDLYNPFQGTIYNDNAECIFEYKNELVNIKFLFSEDDRIEAAMKCESLGINESYQFRPYNLSDEQLHDDILSKEMFLESWGKVNLVSGTTDSRHSIPWAAITNEKNDILYEFDCSGGISGSIIWDIFVEDVNNDGLQDIWTVTCFDNEPNGCRFVCVFYQLETGLFQKEERISVDVPEKYYGDYCIVEFCPTSGYAGHSEEILTEQDVNQMIGCTVIIREDLLVTYDSERRLGEVRTGKSSQDSDLIVEFRYEKAGYGWENVSSEAMGYRVMADNNLHEAIGEEYYEKINGVIHNTSFQVQRFYTLEDENRIIMYSLLTGQYFILERIT